MAVEQVAVEASNRASELVDGSVEAIDPALVNDAVQAKDTEPEVGTTEQIENQEEDQDQKEDTAERFLRTERILDQHHDTVFRYAYRLCGCASTAEDITQDVYLRAFRSIHQLRDELAARGWLLVITRNEFARWCRRKSETIGVDLDSEACTGLSVSPQSTLEQTEWVESALQQLPNEFRTVLVMFYFEELSYAEIAEYLQIPIGTVMSRLSRGRAHMKAALDSVASSSD